MEEGIETIFIPKKWRMNFKIKKLKEKNKEMNMVLVEKEECVPKMLAGADYVLNGYMEPVEIIDFPFRGKLMYS